MEKNTLFILCVMALGKIVSAYPLITLVERLKKQKKHKQLVEMLGIKPLTIISCLLILWGLVDIIKIAMDLF